MVLQKRTLFLTVILFVIVCCGGCKKQEDEKITSIKQLNEPACTIGVPEGGAGMYMAEKYLPGGCSGVIAFGVKGGRAAAVRFMDSLKLASNEVHVADIRTCVLHPASATHRQLTDEQLIAAGISPGLIRLSVGLENIEDILADLQLGLDSL